MNLDTTIGSVTLRNPILTAAGTTGHADELSRYMDLKRLGGVVAKSLSAKPWPGNPAPRLHPLPGGGMLNSVGLQNPGVEAWLTDDLPRLSRSGATVIGGIWGGTVEDYEQAAAALHGAASLMAGLEVNLSCPNLGSSAGTTGASGRHEMFASTASGTAAVVARSTGKLPVWAKLSAAVSDLPAVAAAALEAGAEAITLINTMPAMAIDLEQRRPVLGGGGGGMSGPPLHPVAVRAVWDCRRALGPVPIVAAGGVSTGADAVELLMAGASAVQVGTATFREPAAALRVLDEIEGWCERHGVTSVADLVGAAH